MTMHEKAIAERMNQYPDIEKVLKIIDGIPCEWWSEIANFLEFTFYFDSSLITFEQDKKGVWHRRDSEVKYAELVE